MSRWPVRPLGEVAQSQLGKMLDAAKNKGTALPYLRNINVRWDGFSLDDVQEMRFESDELDRFTIRAGDLVVCEGGEPGRCAVWSDKAKTIQYQKALHRVRPGPDLDARWTYYQLRFLAETGRLSAYFTGTTIKHLTGDALRRVAIAVPPLDVQRRIVEKLDEVLAQSRAAREQLEAVPELVEKYRQSVLGAAFRGDLTADWRRKNPNVEVASKLLERIRVERRKAWEMVELAKMKAKSKVPKDDKWKAKYIAPEPAQTSGLPALPPTWCWARIEELCPFDGPAVYGIIQPGEHVEGGVPYIRPLDIADDGTVALDALKRTSRSIADAYSRSMLRSGDVVLSIVGTIGKVLVVTPELEGANITQSSIRIRPPSGVPTGFTQLLLQSPLLRRQYDQYRFGNAVQRLNVEHVRRLVVPLAPTSEASFLEATVMERLALIRGAASPEPDDIGVLEHALLAKAFSGELA